MMQHMTPPAKQLNKPKWSQPSLWEQYMMGNALKQILEMWRWRRHHGQYTNIMSTICQPTGQKGKLTFSTANGQGTNKDGDFHRGAGAAWTG